MHSFPRSDEAFFDTEDNIEKSCPLLEYILDCLHKICLYDTQRFVSKERADSLMTPLVDQVSLTPLSHHYNKGFIHRNGKLYN